MSKKKKKQSDSSGDSGGDGGFMQMFVTLSLILLAFFILLNSMSVPSEEKLRKALGSLLGSFGMLPGANNVLSSGEAALSQESQVGNEGIYKLFKQLKQEIADMLAKSTDGNDDANVTFDKSTGEIKVILSESLLFPAGTAVVSPRIFPLLDSVASIAHKTEGKIRVIGHTDARRTRGGISNWELSLRRGALVGRHIEAAGHLGREIVSASGAAHHQPTEDNNTKAGRSANRRVEIVVKTKKGSLL